VKASLRSVLTEDDEEMEIVPHVKGSTDFEVYESVLVKPREVIMPWDENTKPTYSISYSATGGGKVYTWSTDNEDLAVADSEGKVTTHSGPGSFKVKAAMAKASQNYDEVTVHILPVSSIALKESSVEFATGTPHTMALQMFAILPDSDEEILFTDCADIPYEVTLSDNINFEVTGRAERGQTQIYNSCTTFQILAKKPSAICKVSISYKEPSSGRTLRTHTSITAFDTLESLYPKRDQQFNAEATTVLAVGSTGNVVFKGGPQPWHGKPSGHFKQIEIDEPELIRVVRKDQPSVKGAYNDLHVYEVTCLNLGATKVTFVTGNNPSATNTPLVSEENTVVVECSAPSKISLTPKPVDPETRMAASLATAKIMSDYKKNLQMILTVKDSKGKTFDSVESLNFEFKVSDPSILSPKDTLQVPKYNIDNFDVTSNGKPFQVFAPQGKAGEVEVTVKLAGYNQKFLDAAQITDAPALPKVLDDDDEDNEEDDQFVEHNHSLTDSVEFFFTTEQEIQKIKQKI
jgi:nuclear pore complex protein Nup210